MNISIVTLIAVLVFIAFRQLGNVRLQIWQVMSAGAVVVVLTGQIGIGPALKAINPDVMLFLFGMFVVGHGLEESGYLAHLSYRYFKRARTKDRLLLMIVFGAGLLSACLMNDTIAIIGTPAVLLIARKHRMSRTNLLLALAFAVTIGSAMSPIGNPQNLLIAVNGKLRDPFVTFPRWLFLPTVVNLFLAYLLLKRFYPGDFHGSELSHSQEPIRDREMAFLSRLSLQILLALILTKILLPSINLQLPHIAVASALPLLFGSSQRWRILRNIDWHTLAFFAGMFVLMESVWESGFFQSVILQAGVNLRSTEMILSVSVVLSQFTSNVPLVALYQPVLLRAGASPADLMALAAGSTIAGNMFIFGAASNVIIIQQAERRESEGIGFLEFARAGIPLTVLNIAVYWAFLRFV